MQLKQLLLSLCVLLCSGYYANAQNYDDLRKVTDTYAFTGATVEVSPGNVLQNATIVVEDGLIKSVGTSGNIPATAKVIQLDSLYVYPGFISGATHAGIPKKSGEEGQSNRGNRNGRIVGNPPKERAGITPHIKAATQFSPSEKAIENLRTQGFTIAHVLPEGRMLPGKGALVALGEGAANEMLIKDETALFSQFKNASGVAPGTIIGVMAKWRDLYKTAQSQKSYNSTFKTSSRGKERPDFDAETEAFFPVIDKQQPVFFAADKVLTIQRAMTLQKELGFNMVLFETKQADKLASSISSKNIPLFLSMDLPKAEEKKQDKKEDKTDDEGETEETMTALEKSLQAEKEALEARKSKILAEYEAQAASLAAKGIRFGFSTLEAKPKDFNATIGRMIEAGLTPDQALKALTTDAAQLLGISNIAGTIEQGKLAHFAAFTKPFHEEKAQAKYVFIEDQLYEFEVKEKKKKKKKDSADGEEGAASEGADIVGEWDFTIDTPGEQNIGVMTITKDGDDYTGELYTEDDPSDVEEFDITLDGDEISFSFDIDNDGMELNLDFNLTVDGDDMEGAVSVGEFGSFDMEATRTSKPE